MKSFLSFRVNTISLKISDFKIDGTSVEPIKKKPFEQNASGNEDEACGVAAEFRRAAEEQVRNIVKQENPLQDVNRKRVHADDAQREGEALQRKYVEQRKTRRRQSGSSLPPQRQSSASKVFDNRVAGEIGEKRDSEQKSPRPRAKSVLALF